MFGVGRAAGTATPHKVPLPHSSLLQALAVSPSGVLPCTIIEVTVDLLAVSIMLCWWGSDFSSCNTPASLDLNPGKLWSGRGSHLVGIGRGRGITNGMGRLDLEGSEVLTMMRSENKAAHIPSISYGAPRMFCSISFLHAQGFPLTEVAGLLLKVFHSGQPG